MRLNGLHHFGYDSERVDPDFDWWIDAIRADDRDRIRRFTDSLLEGDGPAFDELTADRSQSSIEYRLQCADRTYADCSGRGILLFDDDSVKTVGTLTDIIETPFRSTAGCTRAPRGSTRPAAGAAPSGRGRRGRRRHRGTRR